MCCLFKNKFYLDKNGQNGKLSEVSVLFKIFICHSLHYELNHVVFDIVVLRITYSYHNNIDESSFYFIYKAFYSAELSK